MIPLYPTTALMIYLCATLATLLGIWVYQHYLSRNKKLVIQENKPIVCEYCHFVYLSSLGNKVSKCPQCDSYNRK